MNKTLVILFAILLSSLQMVCGAGRLETGFYNPPAEARPHTYWFWMNGNITREGITADLEAMSRVGIGGVLIMNVAGPRMSTDIPPGPVEYFSKEWLDMVKFAAREAKRLNMTMNVHNCAGWATMGGPWIPPEHSMQILTVSEYFIPGNQTVKRILPHPETRENFYRDIAVYAFPTKFNTGYRVHQWPQKSGQSGSRTGRQPDLKPAPKGSAVPLDSIIDLTDKVSADGVLSWDAPPGAWKIIRMGHTSTGHVNAPAPKAGRGLEVDKFKRQGVDLQWQKGIKPILDHLGPLAIDVVNTLHIDSYEAGLGHWTPAMVDEFKKRRGYDPTPYLLALTGRLIEDGPTTDRFLWDFRITISELFTDNFYGYFADLCHENGMQFSNEPYTSCFEGLAVAAKADLPMAEFWVDGNYSFSAELAASLAHIHGRPIAGAEAFTAGPDVGKWQNYPGSIKRVGDLMWTRGINRFTFHVYAHQPWLDKVPGMTMGQYGCHFDRNNTWWEQGKAWIDYIRRSQFLLQYGEPTADVLAFAGQAAPNRTAYIKGLKEAGYEFDSCGTDIFPKLKVEDGFVVLPTGKRYRLLVMPNHQFQTPAIARKVRDLVAAGAAVYGPKPTHSPSLANLAEWEKEVVAIGQKVWGKCDGETVKSNRYAKGIVFNGISAAEALAKLSVSPAAQLPKELAWIQRRSGNAEVFFVSNQSDKTVSTIAGFRVSGKKPEFFDAENGTIRPAEGWTVSGEQTQVPLSLESEKSIFVVFRNPAKPASDPYVAAEGPDGKSLGFDTSKATCLRAWDNGTQTLRRKSGKTTKLKVTGLPKPLNLTGPWDIRFPPKRGAPEKARFDKLISWTKHENSGIKYFSGTATNTIKFKLPKGFLKKNQQVWLDLGDVAVIAEVRLNNKKLGTLWHKPFRIEVSKALKKGTNTLEVDVTNLWINRLIGDEQYPADCEWTEKYLTKWPDWLTSGKQRPVPARVTFTTWKHYNADDKLQPSGLIGPVTLRPARLVPIP